MRHWYIGCSGFYYKEWKGLFYPKDLPQKEWFQYYTQHFNALELNNTFYRFPELSALQHWHDDSPKTFRFAVKVPREITHDKAFGGTEDLLNEFYNVLQSGLQEKLGCVLFQLPPSFDYTAERLKTLLAQLDTTFTNVVEFRNISWWRDDVIETLRKKGITFCGVSYPGLIDNVIVNTPHPYYRFHGVPKLHNSAYDYGFLKNVVEAIDTVKEVKAAYLFFNNTMSGAALENAKTVQQLSNHIM
jgi:uncharacterized protein YecE (DUF72 family)